MIEITKTIFKPLRLKNLGGLPAKIYLRHNILKGEKTVMILKRSLVKDPPETLNSWVVKRFKNYAILEEYIHLRSSTLFYIAETIYDFEPKPVKLPKSVFSL